MYLNLLYMNYSTDINVEFEVCYVSITLKQVYKPVQAKFCDKNKGPFRAINISKMASNGVAPPTPIKL